MAFKKRIFFLHGFLGRPSDWDKTVSKLSTQKNDIEFNIVDLLGSQTDLPQVPLSEFGASFIQHFQITPNTQNYLVGYSMGGRLGLHVLDFDPKLWAGAIFVSTGTGLKTETERQQRIPDDQKWADRFLKEDFQSVMKDWNAQPIFKYGAEPVRFEQAYSRTRIAGALTLWSLAYQKDFAQAASLWSTPQVWLCGEGDSKYQGIYQGISLSKNLRINVVEKASHRILFDRPDYMSTVINQMINGG